MQQVIAFGQRFDGKERAFGVRLDEGAPFPHQPAFEREPPLHRAATLRLQRDACRTAGLEGNGCAQKRLLPVLCPGDRTGQLAVGGDVVAETRQHGANAVGRRIDVAAIGVAVAVLDAG